MYMIITKIIYIPIYIYTHTHLPSWYILVFVLFRSVKFEPQILPLPTPTVVNSSYSPASYNKLEWEIFLKKSSYSVREKMHVRCVTHQIELNFYSPIIFFCGFFSDSFVRYVLLAPYESLPTTWSRLPGDQSVSHFSFETAGMHVLTVERATVITTNELDPTRPNELMNHNCGNTLTLTENGDNVRILITHKTTYMKKIIIITTPVTKTFVCYLQWGSITRVRAAGEMLCIHHDTIRKSQTRNYTID